MMSLRRTFQRQECCAIENLLWCVQTKIGIIDKSITCRYESFHLCIVVGKNPVDYANMTLPVDLVHLCYLVTFYMVLKFF